MECNLQNFSSKSDIALKLESLLNNPAGKKSVDRLYRNRDSTILGLLELTKYNLGKSYYKKNALKKSVTLIDRTIINVRT